MNLPVIFSYVSPHPPPPPPTPTKRVLAFVCTLRDDDRLEALRVAIGQAITAVSSSSSSDDDDEPGRAHSLALLPLPSISSFSAERQGNPDTNDDATQQADIGGGVVGEGEEEEGEGEDVVDILEQRALRLEHKMTAKARLGADMAERLSPYLLSGYVCALFIYLSHICKVPHIMFLCGGLVLSGRCDGWWLTRCL